jgi:hypothetical protein
MLQTGLGAATVASAFAGRTERISILPDQYLSFPLIEHFWDVNESFCKPLSKVEAAFNPIAAYRQDAAKARRLSEGAKAKDRDAHGDALRLLENIPFFPGYDISLEDSMRR